MLKMAKTDLYHHFSHFFEQSPLYGTPCCVIISNSNRIAILNCQSEARIFGVKNEKYHGFTLTKGRVLYIDISRFSEPEEAATNEVGTTLTGC